MSAAGSIAIRQRAFGLRRARSADAVSPSLRIGVSALVGVLLVLELWARANDYGLRIVSDTPTYIALLYRLAAHPLQPVSPYFATGSSSHATPDLQLEALLWRLLHHGGRVDPVGAYRLLALAGIVGTLLALHAVFIWVRGHAGSRAAWISLPVLLSLLGPAHVIWAGDLSLHGFLYGGYFAQTLALALALYTLALLDRPSFARLPLAVAFVTLVLLTHPFTGVVLIGLVCLRSCQLALGGTSAWWVGPAALAGGFTAAHAWPVYPIGPAISASGVSAEVVLSAAVAAPVAAWWLGPDVSLPGLDRLLPALPARVTTALAWTGVAGLTTLAEWQLWQLAGNGPPRLGVYWVTGLGRWSLLFVGGTVGLAGLYVLARRGRVLPAVWFIAAYVSGVVGALGLSFPLWYRVLLFAQVPLALGVAVIAAETAGRSVRTAIVICVAGSLALKAGTLLAAPPTATYFGNSWLQDGYELARVIPPGPGIVASDPFASYYVPAATGRSVLTLTPAHLGSAEEIREAEHGYRLLHQLYDGANWWHAAEQLYHGGVRYVIVDHKQSLSPPTLEQFVANPPVVNPYGGVQRRLLSGYFYRLNRIARLVSDSQQYAIYRLQPRRLANAAGRPWSQDRRGVLRAIAPGTGPIATDPLTGSVLRAAGRPVVTVAPGHLATGPQIRSAERGYALIHRLYEGSSWWETAAALYETGVRYVVVDHMLSLSSPTLEQFLASPPHVNPGGGLQRHLLGAYFYELNRVGHVVYDSPWYTVYRLRGGLLSPRRR